MRGIEYPDKWLAARSSYHLPESTQPCRGALVKDSVAIVLHYLGKLLSWTMKMAPKPLVLVMPWGRSAHLEMGYAAGDGIPTIILVSDGEPELMYRMAKGFAIDLDGVVE